MSIPELRQLLAVVDVAYNRQSWHGTNLRGSIRGVSVRQAVWRPSPKRHNIWELVVDAAYWRYAALRRMTSARRGSFPLDGSNWFERGGRAGEEAWRADVTLLDQTHRALCDAIAGLAPRDFTTKPPGSTVTNFALLFGRRRLYHVGQIQLLKRLFADRGRRRQGAAM